MSAQSPLFTWRQYLLGVFVLLLVLLDPFGLSSSSDAASAQWLNRMFAGSYPTTGQQQIAVILIDDEYLLRNNTFWPMPYAEQSKLFKRLLTYKPKAVFVDFMYSHDHSFGNPALGSQLLANVFERYRLQGIELLLANTGVKRGEAGQVNSLTQLADVSTPALVTWSGVGDKYPLAVDTPVGTMETPAFALYRQYCAGRSCADLPKDAQAAAQKQPIAVQWGLTLAPEQEKALDIKACSTSSGTLIEVVKQFFQAIFWKLGEPAQTRCAYNLTLQASALEANSPEDRALLTEMLHDRVVLVGAQIMSTGDLVQSPVQGQIAGVYLHAMALDNLITQGMGYDRDLPNLPGVGISCLDLLEAALLGLIALLKALHERCVADQQRQMLWTPWKQWFFKSPLPSWVLVVLLLALLCDVLSSWHITPVNVLGIVLLSLVLFSDKVKAAFERKHG